MSTSTTQQAIAAEADAQGAPFTGEFAVTANDFGGVDFEQGTWRCVRFSHEDQESGWIEVFIFGGRGQTVLAKGSISLDLESAPRCAVQLATALFEAVRHA